MVTFDGTPTLLEALTAQRAWTTGHNKANKAAQIPERCAIYRGQNQVVWVELKTLIESGQLRWPICACAATTWSMCPVWRERFVSVLGEVQHPGAVPLTNTSTLASVLAEAGGFTGKAGNKPHIQIVDPAKGTSRVISLQRCAEPGQVAGDHAEAGRDHLCAAERILPRHLCAGAD